MNDAFWSLTKWITENREWVFSGVGVTILTSLVIYTTSFIKNRRAKNPEPGFSLKGSDTPILNNSGHMQNVTFQMGTNNRDISVKSEIKADSGKTSIKTPENITNLIAKVQGNQTSLSQCIAEALPIARLCKETCLEQFCAGELSGWEIKENLDVLQYRAVHLYLTNRPINPNAIWGGPNVVLRRMAEDTNSFIQVDMALPYPISELERLATSDSPQSLFLLSTTMRAILPNSPTDGPIYAYGAPNIVSDLIQEIRQKLTNLLIECFNRH